MLCTSKLAGDAAPRMDFFAESRLILAAEGASGGDDKTVGRCCRTAHVCCCQMYSGLSRRVCGVVA
eukprot:5141600-Pleurochrysis_carterae.AAC.1